MHNNGTTYQNLDTQEEKEKVDKTEGYELQLNGFVAYLSITFFCPLELHVRSVKVGSQDRR